MLQILAFVSGRWADDWGGLLRTVIQIRVFEVKQKMRFEAMTKFGHFAKGTHIRFLLVGYWD